jgi:hypothetical protein
MMLDGRFIYNPVRHWNGAWVPVLWCGCGAHTTAAPRHDLPEISPSTTHGSSTRMCREDEDRRRFPRARKIMKDRPEWIHIRSSHCMTIYGGIGLGASEWPECERLIRLFNHASLTAIRRLTPQSTAHYNDYMLISKRYLSERAP